MLSKVLQDKIKEINSLIAELLETPREQSAFLLFNKVQDIIDKNPNLKSESQALYHKYELAKNKLRFMCLPFFDDFEAVVQYIKNNLGIALELLNYDVWKYLRIHLVSIYNLEERNKFKQRLKQAVEICPNKIIKSSDYNVELPERVKDWVKDFIINIEVDGKIDNVKRADYLNNNKNYTRLKKEDKEKVSKLLNLYETLSKPSIELEGAEETMLVKENKNAEPVLLSSQGVEPLTPYTKKIKDFKAKLVEQGLLEDNKTNDWSDENNIENSNNTFIKDRQEKISILEKMLSDYAPDSLEAKALQEEIKRLKINNG